MAVEAAAEVHEATGAPSLGFDGDDIPIDVLQLILSSLASKAALQALKSCSRCWCYAVRCVLCSESWRLSHLRLSDMLPESQLEDSLLLKRLQASPGDACLVCDDDAHRRLPLHALFVHRRLSIVPDLLSIWPPAASHCDVHGLWPLHYAAKANAEATIVHELMLASSSALYATDDNGWLPLHYAAATLSTDAVIVLNHAHPQACAQVDHMKRTPLHVLAASELHRELHATTHDAASPSLAEAARTLSSIGSPGPSKDVLECVRQLLDSCPQAKHLMDCNGDLPWSLAVQSQASPAVLAELSVEPKAKDDDGAVLLPRFRHAALAGCLLVILMVMCVYTVLHVLLNG